MNHSNGTSCCLGKGFNQRRCRANIPSNNTNELNFSTEHSGFSGGLQHTEECRLLSDDLDGQAVALQRVSRSLDKYLKFIAAQDDAFIADVRSYGYKHRLLSGACNA